MDTLAETFNQSQKMVRDYFRGIILSRISPTLCTLCDNSKGPNCSEKNNNDPRVPSAFNDLSDDRNNGKEYKDAWLNIWNLLTQIRVDDPVAPTKKRSLTETFELENGDTISVCHAKTLKGSIEECQIRVIHDVNKGPPDIQITISENKIAKSNIVMWTFIPKAEDNFCKRNLMSHTECAEIFSDPDMYWNHLRSLLHNGRIKTYTIKERQEGEREVVTRFYNSYGRVEEYRKFFRKNDPDFNDAMKVMSEIPI